VRAVSFAPPAKDLGVLLHTIEGFDARHILEFGPGDSTQFMLDRVPNAIIHTCEDNYGHFVSAQRRFLSEKRVTVVHYLNELSIEIPALGAVQFDLAFVDGPYGGKARTLIRGAEDCSRYNTLRFALARAPVAVLHDANRPAERRTVERLCDEFGYVAEFPACELGMAIVWRA